MSKQRVYYYVRGQIFYNDYPKWNGLAKAKHYCKVNDIDTSEIYELFNDKERKYLELLLNKEDVKEIKTHTTIFNSLPFTNCNGDEIPSFTFQASFVYLNTNTGHHRATYIPNSIYDLTREITLIKTIFDREMLESNKYLEIYVFDEKSQTFKEWKIGDKELYKELKKQEHENLLTQKKEIRDRQRFDRLLKLRDEGKITETQTQELYKLEKVYGGKNG